MRSKIVLWVERSVKSTFFQEPEVRLEYKPEMAIVVRNNNAGQKHVVCIIAVHMTVGGFPV